jgi:MOSC domain-containing protein YiiM
VEQEVLDEFRLAHGALDEQITVAGATLSNLAAKNRFRVGEVLLEVLGPCEPCQKMNRHGPGMQERLLGKRGTLAKVVEGGVIRIGDQVCAST